MRLVQQPLLRRRGLGRERDHDRQPLGRERRAHLADERRVLCRVLGWDVLEIHVRARVAARFQILRKALDERGALRRIAQQGVCPLAGKTAVLAERRQHEQRLCAV